MSYGRNWAGRLVAVAIATTPVTAMAQEEVAPVNTGNITLEASVDVVTEYVFRGIRQGPQNDQGIIIQPGVDIGIALYEDENISVGGYVGTWNSFNDGDGWYESDLYAGVGVGLPYGLSLDVAFIALENPDGGGEFAQEIDVTVAYDDSELWANAGVDFMQFGGLQPYALLAFETEGGSDGNPTAGTNTGSEGVYLELGIEPSILLFDNPTYPITLSVPVAVGMSLEDYYEYVDANGNLVDETYGFTSVGFTMGVPLAFIPAEYGTWEASAGLNIIFLSDELQDLNAGNGDDDVLYIGSIGVSMSY